MDSSSILLLLLFHTISGLLLLLLFVVALCSKRKQVCSTHFIPSKRQHGGKRKKYNTHKWGGSLTSFSVSALLCVFGSPASSKNSFWSLCVHCRVSAEQQKAKSLKTGCFFPHHRYLCICCIEQSTIHMASIYCSKTNPPLMHPSVLGTLREHAWINPWLKIQLCIFSAELWKAWTNSFQQRIRHKTFFSALRGAL